MNSKGQLVGLTDGLFFVLILIFIGVILVYVFNPFGMFDLTQLKDSVLELFGL